MLSNVKSRGLRYLSLLLTLVFVALAVSIPAFASPSAGMNFNVTPQLPDNQRDPKLSYFDILAEPGSKQTLLLAVKNNTSEEMVVEVEAVSASTTPFGEINYTLPAPNDETLIHPFADIAKPNADRETIAANSTKNIEVYITMPVEEFDGMILGGIRVKDLTARLKKEKEDAERKDSPDAIASDESGVAIINEYQYLIATALRNNEKTLEPDFKLVQVTSEIVNYRAAIVATIRNPMTDVVKAAVFNAEVLPKGETTPIFSISGRSIDFAPNSVINYEFTDEAGAGIPAGDYTFTGKIEFQGKTWDLNQDFTIEPAKAEEVNQAALNQQTTRQGASNTPLWIYIAIGVGILLIILLLVIILKMNKAKKD